MPYNSRVVTCAAVKVWFLACGTTDIGSLVKPIRKRFGCTFEDNSVIRFSDLRI
jgi:hypothetical protein